MSCFKRILRLVKGGKFENFPEYLEFAWQEVISDAVIHRAYSITGTDIQVKMFNERQEIESPWKVPGLVGLHNIRKTH